MGAEPDFDTPITVSGPLRSPRQMLAEQSYSGHTSIHDDETASKLGLQGGAIEGPTHFSQFEPLFALLWGSRWNEWGCISAHFSNICAQGEQVRASVDVEHAGADAARIIAHKADGTVVLTGTASVGPEHPESELEARLARVRPPERLVLLDQMAIGQRGAAIEAATMGFEDHMGDLYPFTLAQKLALITETNPWSTPEGGPTSPWGAPVVPLEMISVLTQATSHQAGFLVRQPSVGLFLDLEIRFLGQPVLVGRRYRFERELVGLGESRRTESWWTRTTVLDDTTGDAVAHTLIHQGVFKESYPGYAAAVGG